MKSKMQNREAKRQALLAVAAELIVRDGPKGLSIKDLAERAQMVRTNVYMIFGSSDPKDRMFKIIVDGFLEKAQNSIATAVVSSTPTSSAVEKLTAVLRITLHLFKEDSRSGKVVLTHLDMKHEAFQPIHQIFKYVDLLIGKALENREIVVGLPASQIRQILFSVMYGLLRALYLDHEEGKTVENQDEVISETSVQLGVLHVLSGFCSPTIRAQVESQMAALKVSAGK